MLKRFIISPPFGNYIKPDWATSVSGTFTLEPRPGLVWNTIKTLRPIKGGWVNKIGLRNRGIDNANFRDNELCSIADHTGGNAWLQICEKIPKGQMVEINASCPNVGHYSISSDVLAIFAAKFRCVVVKVPPTEEGMFMVVKAHKAGINTVHLCNTIPVPGGGESGQRLKTLSLKMVEETKQLFPEMKVIGGGGIYTKQDLKDYENAGADHFSLATIWFTPWKVKRLFDED